jgi:hypothetical protein
LCYAAGGELEQIQFLLGHVSVETTERYLGCKQRIRGAVNDRMIGIEPEPGSISGCVGDNELVNPPTFGSAISRARTVARRDE